MPPVVVRSRPIAGRIELSAGKYVIPLVLLYVLLSVYCTCPLKYFDGFPRNVSSRPLLF